MLPEIDTSDVLPCRGCTRECPNLHSCDHKPWRSAPGAWAEADGKGDAGMP